MQPPPPTQLPPGSVFVKEYRIVRGLAQGGMGAVYEAEYIPTGQRLALKVMHPSQVADPKLRRRFAQEARVGAWIQSEHIVEVLRAGIDEVSGTPWLAMELLKGETVATRVNRYAPLDAMPAAEVWAILSQLCRALTAAHAKNVIHRDLKPENVFLTSTPRPDAPFTVKILDFGIAKRVDPYQPGSAKTSAIGTPLWMAPEQNETAELTPATDVWAMGLLTFRMFTGRYYWLSANEPELNMGWLYSELVNDPIAPASERAEALGAKSFLPQGFDAWFARCVARDVRARFPSALEMTAALATFAPPGFAPWLDAEMAAAKSVPRPSSPGLSRPSIPSELPPRTMELEVPPQAPVLSATGSAPPSMPPAAPVSRPYAPTMIGGPAPPPMPVPMPMTRSNRAVIVAGVGLMLVVLVLTGVVLVLRARETPPPPPAPNATQPSPPAAFPVAVPTPGMLPTPPAPPPGVQIPVVQPGPKSPPPSAPAPPPVEPDAQRHSASRHSARSGTHAHTRSPANRSAFP
jgi:serine/threonine protein kinase